MKKKIFQAFSAIVLIVVVSCSSGINIFSDADDVELGAQFAEELYKNSKDYPVYRNQQVKNYIKTRIFDHVLESPDIKKKGVYNYKLEIIDNDTTLNAFAVPGGYIYLYTGLLRYLNSEAALAGVIAHEIGHVERRHSTRRITSAYGLSIILSLVLGNNPSQIAEIAANLFAGLTLLANSRSDEEEADEFAVNSLAGTRYYPGSVKFFFEKMRDEKLIEAGGMGLATFLSTHPDPIARIESANQIMRQRGLEVKHFTDSGTGIFHLEYKRNILNRME